jgi:hypothetical protein
MDYTHRLNSYIRYSAPTLTIAGVRGILLRIAGQPRMQPCVRWLGLRTASSPGLTGIAHWNYGMAELYIAFWAPFRYFKSALMSRWRLART